MFKSNEVERKIRERNQLNDMQINLSLCRVPDHFFLAAPPVIVMRLKIFPENIQNSYF